VRTEQDLRNILARIDGRGYKAYKDIAGSYTFEDFTLHIDHVQADPFAAPSKLRLRVSQSQAGLPRELSCNTVRRVALEDFLARQVREAIRRVGQGPRGTGKSGQITIDAGGQEVLQRTAVVLTPEWVEARLQVGLPAAGRRVLGRQAESILCDTLPRIARESLCWEALPGDEAQVFVECVENQEHIRNQLAEMGLVAFVADGAILPRASGASDRPMARKEAVPFRAPDSLRVTIQVPNPVPTADGPTRELRGLGIPRGVTLIVGGGYHGKSTLLRALERGVYPHIPGDGREYVVTCADAVKIRAEDGRRVEQVDIEPFISHLPYGRSTKSFCSDDASGSTSQAANIMEALEIGATCLLLDEDTSATNFMIRDGRMQSLVHKQHEPITPFLDRVRELYERHGVSTVLVMGGCGDYFDVADTVIMMRDYLPMDVTTEARRIAGELPSPRRREAGPHLARVTERIPLASSFDAPHVEQLVDISQTRAVGLAIHLARKQFMDGQATLREVIEAVDRFFDAQGLDALDPLHRADRHPGNFARPRKHEIAAAINRLRTVKMKQKTGPMTAIP